MFIPQDINDNGSVGAPHSKREASIITGASTVVSPRTAQAYKRRHQSQPRGGFTKPSLSVKDTIILSSKATKYKDVGIPGYPVKLWHHDVEKPIVFGIHKDKKARHYLDNYLKAKSIVPPPNAFNMM